MTHSFITQTVGNYGLNTPSSSSTATVEESETPQNTNQQQLQQQQQQQQESTRRYIQWRDDDVTVLLNDLEKPGHYESWKDNKSGYSKRVAEEVFRNIMYHEAIKFKVRWLENRYRKWEEQLTAPDVVNDDQAKAQLTEKMRKDFAFYDRCKRVFAENNNTESTTATATNDTSNKENSRPVKGVPQTEASKDDGNNATPSVPERSNPSTTPIPSSSTAAPAPIHDTTTSSTKAPVPLPPTATAVPSSSSSSSSSATALTIPRPSGETAFQRSWQASSAADDCIHHHHHHQEQHPQGNKDHYDNAYMSTSMYSKRRKTGHRISDGIAEERQLKVMEMDLVIKRMEHEERMQQMKLEQLRLEIELEKIRASCRNSHHSNSSE